MVTADAELSACVVLARPQVATAEHFGPCVAGLSAALVELPDLGLPTLALDLGLLLAGDVLGPGFHPLPVRLASAVRNYEDHFLARLVSDRRWLSLQEAWLATPARARPAGVGLLVERLTHRLGVPQSGGFTQAAVRRLAARAPGEVLEEGVGILGLEPDLEEALALRFEAVAKAARNERTLLSDAEVFLLENVATLESLAARVALSHLADAAQAVEERLPSRLKASPAPQGDAPTALEQESALPVGGWSSLANQGSPESLVTSELIYMEDGERPDLFDVRFVEGELLYYARDESVALRKRRTLCVVFDASLDSARLLDAGEVHQRLVWALASVIAVVRKLSAWLSNEALSFELTFVAPKGARPLAGEEQLLALLLREWQERGRLLLSDAASVEQALERLTDDHGARADLVLVSASSQPGAPVGFRKAAALWVDVAPAIHTSGRAGPLRIDEGTAAERWTALARVLLATLLS